MRKAILSSITLLCLVTTLHAASREKQWQAVNQAMEKGKPQSAIKALDEIIPVALADQAYAEAVKAICQKIALEGEIQGGKAEEKIVRLEAEIVQAPETIRPVMQTILAHWTWQYFQQNRWRFMRRSQTAEPPGDDFTTWDLPRILAEIDKHYSAALANAAFLKTIPITEYDDLLEKGTVPDSYRPTLYDFLAHEALSFYTTGEQAGAKPMDTFEPRADSPILDSMEAFLKWQPQTTDTTSATLKAIGLYQDLLRFHHNDGDPSALIDVDLHRLVYAHQVAVGPEKDDRYKSALKDFVDRWTDHPVAARAHHHWAQLEHQQGNYITAHQLATRGQQNYPNSVGGNQCYNLIQQIEAKEATIQTERVWNDPLPDIQVSYRNVTQVYLRIVAWDVKDYLKNRRNNEDERIQKLLGKKPAHAWSHALPATTDYKRRTEAFTAPNDLNPGFYYLIASHRASFEEANNQISVTPIWVSDLALVTREGRDDWAMEGFVLDARTGNPIGGATVTRWMRYNYEHWQQEDSITSDDEGRFRFVPSTERKPFSIAVDYKGHLLSGAAIYRNPRSTQQRAPREQTVFFTDRSLYRPGQTIHYKGLSLNYHQSQGHYQTLVNRDITVIFRDANRQEISRQQHRTNDYGSFSGSFTAPRDRVLGRMQLVAEGEPRGSTAVRVEEYKRPKFRVELSAPTASSRLNTDVTVSGRATAFTGAAIGGAEVRWRVERRATFPDWCWWASYMWPPHAQSEQNIGQGTATTAADGSFNVTFITKPNLAIPEKDEPVFTFRIVADVTDTTGETRSQEYSLRVGYTALQTTLNLDPWQTVDKPVRFTVQTKSLQGEPTSAVGKLTLYRLQEPEQVKRKPLSSPRPWEMPYHRISREPSGDDTDPKTWKLGERVSEQSIRTDGQGETKIAIPLAAGIYRAVVQTQDRFGRDVTARQTLTVLDTKSTHFDVPIADHFAASHWSVVPGKVFTALWGTGYPQGRAFVEIECNGKALRAFWTSPDRTQELIEQPVTEEMRGGFTVRITYVRENRAYFHEHIVDVPWSNKQLTIKWEHFRSKLTPGQEETWTAIIEGPNATQATAEMVAGLYDVSLDQYYTHTWASISRYFRTENMTRLSTFANNVQSLQHMRGNWRVHTTHVQFSYRRFPQILMTPMHLYGGYGMAEGGVGGRGRMEMRLGAAAPMAAESFAMDSAAMPMMEESLEAKAIPDEADTPVPDLSQVSLRKNLQETAFFFPHLVSNEEGAVRMEFTMPEALTEWKFQGFAHDNGLRSGYLTDTVVTAKDLMVVPNAPRFVREGDVIDFTVKVSNESAARQTGTVRLSLTDARTGDSRDTWLGDSAGDQTFDVPSKESQTYSWRLTVPDGGDFLVYKAVAATDRLSDGEEGYLPVLSRRILVTESLPLPIRGPKTKTFAFDKLLASAQSDTLKHQSLTVEMTSQPAWYAMMALPYLLEFPHECSEQVFHRLYANSLAQHIAAGDPKIRRVFDLWQATPALDSPLEKNQDLKSVTIEETPWKRQALAESQARRNVGILFDENRLRDETARTLFQLKEMQGPDGLWPWFPGGRGNPYISLTIATGFGRLRHLGLRDLDISIAVQALDGLDRWMDKRYRDILKRNDKQDNHLSATIALYLYGRSFFREDKPVDDKYQEAFNYWQDQARKYWLSQSRLSQGHLALALKRFGDQKTPNEIMTSISEHAVHNEELGMFWRDTEVSWWWYRAPIETQALMIEAYDEVIGDTEAVEACQVWLLKQKQTQDWKTTTATADAVYALLLRGKNLLSSDTLVEVTLGDRRIEPETVEAGTGYYEKRFVRGEIDPAMGQVTVKKIDEGVSWGAVHWQYLEDIGKITPHEDTPLQLKKVLYKKENTNRGPTLKPIDGPLSVGDELVTRIELRVDRDMEYVHLKDQRGSGTEPVNVLSRYRYQDGLAYYESTRDTASHFFIDYLPKGTYVFEYSTRVQHKGRYPSGIATIQCMYAPEFNSHSESMELTVK
ncbi:alpha-2-macroglobulin [Planctomycetota bacterium]